MNTLISQRGFTAWPIVVIVAILALWGFIYLQISNPGGKPNSIHLSPPTLVLVQGIPSTVDVALVLNHPLPNSTVNTTWSVDIDEDDYWDDDLIDTLTVTRTPSAPQASGSFQLTCSALKATGEFDLTATPGTTDISRQEVTHMVHAEGPGDNSGNISVTCVPPPAAGTGSGSAGDGEDE
jgi:hypothetical protein